MHKNFACLAFADQFIKNLVYGSLKVRITLREQPPHVHQLSVPFLRM